MWSALKSFHWCELSTVKNVQSAKIHPPRPRSNLVKHIEKHIEKSILCTLNYLVKKKRIDHSLDDSPPASKLPASITHITNRLHKPWWYSLRHLETTFPVQVKLPNPTQGHPSCISLHWIYRQDFFIESLAQDEKTDASLAFVPVDKFVDDCCLRVNFERTRILLHTWIAELGFNLPSLY